MFQSRVPINWNVILIAGTKLKFGPKNVYLKNVTFVRLNQLNVRLRSLPWQHG